MLRRRLMAGAGFTMGALLLSGGMGAHRWATTHVEHYTGTTPRTTNCGTCHFEAEGGTVMDRILRPRYRSPLDLAVCAGGKLFATAQDGDALLEIDPAARRLVREIPVGRRPNGVAVDAACRTAYVANQDGASISVVDLARGAAVATLPAGDGPAGIALTPDGSKLFVANSRGEDISVLDVGQGAERARLSAGAYPYGAAISPDGTRVLMGSQLAQPRREGEPLVSEVTVVDAVRDRVASRLMLADAHLLEGIAFTPQGDLALAVLVRPKNLVPVLQVERGWVMTGSLAVLDPARRRAVQIPLDDVDAFYADPSDAAVTPDGRYVFVSHGGADVVTVIDLAAVRALIASSTDEDLESLPNRLGASSRYVVKRIPTSSNPRGLAVSPDGRFVYVAERLDDRIGVIDVARLEKVAEIDLGGPRHETLARRGEKVFNSANFTLQRQFSCRSCHPENHMDRLQYDFESDGLGKNLVDNKTLLGLKGTAPFKWNGRNTSIYMQCGIRFARVLMRSQPFEMRDLNALVAYLNSLEPPPNGRRLASGELTPAQRRGKEIFERVARRDHTPIPENNRCVTCHSGPRFTDLRSSDVGSASETDTEKKFDTPGLENLLLSSPYLHDGKALTLEEIWTIYSPDDTHGVTNDLGKEGLNDLIEYLKTL